MKAITFFIALLFHFNSFMFAQKNDVEKNGDILQIALPISALATSVVWNEDKSIIQFAKTLGASMILTYSIKMIVDKERPNGATDGLSFPSGHTSSAFTGAAFLQRKHGWKIGIPAYILASYVGYSRIYAKRHDFWDVLSGATVGISSAYFFTSKEKNNINFKFSKEKDNLLFGLAMNF